MNEREQTVQTALEVGYGILECRHIYHIVTADITVRYCEKCGLSFVLDGSYGWHWNRVQEPEERQDA